MRPLFKKRVLGKYDATYFKCDKCEFVQTEDPHWLQESYTNAITSLDIGLIFRNQYMAPLVRTVVHRYLDTEGKYLDFGGGYGMFVRMMRDAGLDFYRQDKFCENLFALRFDIADLDPNTRFTAVTAFEVFEHLVDPVASVKEMLSYADSIIFSTDLQPEEDIESWEYLVPEVGQHIALYHYKTLLEIGRQFKLNVYSNRRNFHMLTPRRISDFEFRQMVRPRVAKLYLRTRKNHPSKLPTDYAMLKKLLNQ